MLRRSYAISPASDRRAQYPDGRGIRVRTAAQASEKSSKRAARGLVRGLMFGVVLVAIAAVVASALGMHKASKESSSDVRPDGLPIYITDEMIETARDMQNQYGHPAGCTLAQIIQESGQGNGLSALAAWDNNLFGMKWAPSFEGQPGVAGPVEWGTNEEYNEQMMSVAGTFIKFKSQKDCIIFRSSVFLQAKTYAENPTIKRAIATHNSALMAWGLQDAGWATDSSYAENLVVLMDQYDLYRFDA